MPREAHVLPNPLHSPRDSSKFCPAHPAPIASRVAAPAPGAKAPPSALLALARALPPGQRAPAALPQARRRSAPGLHQTRFDPARCPRPRPAYFQAACGTAFSRPFLRGQAPCEDAQPLPLRCFLFQSTPGALSRYAVVWREMPMRTQASRDATRSIQTTVPKSQKHRDMLFKVVPMSALAEPYGPAPTWGGVAPGGWGL